jgi:hypothetical protein
VRRILPWAVAAALTLACFAFQNRTGPTYPLEGTVATSRGEVAFKFLRSEEIGTGLQIMLRDPVAPGVAAKVRYRRYRSNDGWSETPMTPGTFRFSRRGTAEEVRGVGATLPSLPERAGKYEYLVLVDDGSGPRSVTGDRPVIARYKAPVPRAVLLVHILVVFLSMTLALRTGLQAIAGGELRGLLWATIGSLLLGAFVLGPIVQWYAFGVWWSGLPFGTDWTDNKVLVELLGWLGAAVAVVVARNARTARAAVLVATAVTLAVYFIPHSIFGSEYDYTRGSGHGTAG